MTFKTQEKIFCQKQVPLEGGTSFPVLTFAAWEDLPGIRHCFTTRAGGVSEGYLSSLNFRRGLYDPDENIRCAYFAISNSLAQINKYGIDVYKQNK